MQILELTPLHTLKQAVIEVGQWNEKSQSSGELGIDEITRRLNAGRDAARRSGRRPRKPSVTPQAEQILSPDEYSPTNYPASQIPRVSAREPTVIDHRPSYALLAAVARLTLVLANRGRVSAS